MEPSNAMHRNASHFSIASVGANRGDLFWRISLDLEIDTADVEELGKTDRS